MDKKKKGKESRKKKKQTNKQTNEKNNPEIPAFYLLSEDFLSNGRSTGAIIFRDRWEYYFREKGLGLRDDKTPKIIVMIG